MTTAPASPRTVGLRLLEARKARGVTQEVAAEHLGMSRPTFIAMEKGERAAKPEELVKLAAFYGRPVSYFLRTLEPVSDFQSMPIDTDVTPGTRVIVSTIAVSALRVSVGAPAVEARSIRASPSVTSSERISIPFGMGLRSPVVVAGPPSSACSVARAKSSFFVMRRDTGTMKRPSG